MKQIKFVILIIATLLFTGCSVEYNLVIDEKSMHEEIKLKYLNNEENKQMIDNLLKNPTPAYYDPNSNETGYYSVESKKNSNITNTINMFLNFVGIY